MIVHVLSNRPFLSLTNRRDGWKSHLYQEASFSLMIIKRTLVRSLLSERKYCNTLQKVQNHRNDLEEKRTINKKKYYKNY